MLVRAICFVHRFHVWSIKLQYFHVFYFSSSFSQRVEGELGLLFVIEHEQCLSDVALFHFRFDHKSGHVTPKTKRKAQRFKSKPKNFSTSNPHPLQYTSAIFFPLYRLSVQFAHIVHRERLWKYLNLIRSLIISCQDEEQWLC